MKRFLVLMVVGSLALAAFSASASAAQHGGRGTAPKAGAKPGAGRVHNGHARSIPPSVRGRALHRNYRFSRSFFSTAHGTRMWVNGRGAMYYWHPPIAGYLPVEFIQTFPPGNQ